MALERIATSNNEENEAPKNAQLKEVKDSIDYEKNNVDVAKLQEFKKMTDDIQKYGWEYAREYDDIMKKAISPFEKKIREILDKNEKAKDINSMSNEELNNLANERMEGQPKELEWQQKLLKRITESGSSEDVQQLNEIVNNNMADVQAFRNRIKADQKMKGESNEGLRSDWDTPSKVEDPDFWTAWSSGEEWWTEW